jgi:hypothetical protein
VVLGLFDGRLPALSDWHASGDYAKIPAKQLAKTWQRLLDLIFV